MVHKVSFSCLHEYDTRESGVTVPIRLSIGTNVVDLTAKVDTGASFCIFQRGLGEMLGLDIESGQRQAISTVTGRFVTYGHNVTLSTLGLTFDIMVYFAADYTFARDLLG
ncbi:MAG: aspartyl protease family protein [Acidobacteriota bacterium]